MADPTPVQVTVKVSGMQATFDIPDIAAAQISWPLDVVDADGRLELGQRHRLMIKADVPRENFTGWTPVGDLSG